MLFTNKDINEIGKKEWNKFCKLVGDFSPFTSYELIEYYSAFKGVKNISFAVFNEAHNVVATVPLATYKNLISFGDQPCPSITIDLNLSNSIRKKIYSYIFLEIKKIMSKKKSNIIFILQTCISSYICKR